MENLLAITSIITFVLVACIIALMVKVTFKKLKIGNDIYDGTIFIFAISINVGMVSIFGILYLKLLICLIMVLVFTALVLLYIKKQRKALKRS